MSVSDGRAYRAEELAGPCPLLRREELLGWGLLLDVPAAEETDPIGDVAREFHLVRDHQHGEVVFGGQLADDARYLAVISGSSAEVTSSNSMT